MEKVCLVLSFSSLSVFPINWILGVVMSWFSMQRVNIKNKFEEEEKEKLLKLQQE